MSNILFGKLFINNFKSKPVIYFLYFFIIIGMLISNTLLLIFGDFYFNSSSELSDREFTTNRISFVFYEKPDYPLLIAQIENEKGITNAVLSCQRQTDNDNITISAYKKSNLHKSRFISGGIDTDVNDGTFICGSEYAYRVESEKNIKIKVGSKINIDDMEMICSGKKSTILSIIKVLIMPLVVFLLVLYLKNFGDILTGVYILFPLCFIVQGVFLSKNIPHIVIAYIFASAIYLILTNMWYNVADSFGCVVVYWILGFIVYLIKSFVIRNRNNKNV